MFAILFEALLKEIQEEIHHFAGWEGGVTGYKNYVNKHFVNKLAFPRNYRSSQNHYPVLLLLRIINSIYFPQITVIVTVLKFG